MSVSVETPRYWRAFVCEVGSDPEWIEGSLSPEMRARLARQFARTAAKLVGR